MKCALVATTLAIAASEQDPACCPTLEVENRYRVVKGALALEDPQ